MFSAYELNKQGDNKQPCCTPFLILNPSIVSCSIPTVASRPAYRFLKRQVRWPGIPICLSVFHNLLWSHSQGFSIVNETEVDVFLEFLCFLYDSANVGNLISGSSAFSKPSLDIWKFLVHVTLQPSMKNFEYNLISMEDECNCPVVWILFSTPLLGHWDESWPFPVLWLVLSFPNLLTYWVQHFD